MGTAWNGLFEIPAFAIGVMCGAFLLVIGVGLGLWIGRRSSVTGDSKQQNHQLRKLLRGLFSFTNGLADDVSRYRALVDQVKHQVAEADENIQHADPDLVVRLISQIVQVNDVLQQRIDRAESTLQDQASEIEAYMSEARTDALTGLANRRVLDDEFRSRITDLRRHRTPLAVLAIDVDHFKKINDTYGHAAGDAALCHVARVLSDTMRDSDLVARTGGEEFTVLLVGTDMEEACQAAERARIAIETANVYCDGNVLPVSVSCGVTNAMYQDDAQSTLKRADQALYASKSAGRNCSHYHNGRQCLAITRRARQTQVGNATGSFSDASAVADRDFIKVCNDLRAQLNAVLHLP